MKKGTILFILFFLTAGYSFGLTLPQAIAEALNNNPSLKVSSWKLQTLLEKERAADSGVNTMFNINFNNIPTDSFSLSQDMMSQLKIGFQQKIFFPGKLSTKKRISFFGRKLEEWNHISKKRKITAITKQIYYHLLYLNKVTTYSKATLTLLTQFKKIAQIKYTVGTGIFQDMAKADFEVSRLKEILIKLEDKKQRASILLTTLLGRKPSSKTINIVNTKIHFKLRSLNKINKLLLKKSTSIKKSELSLQKVKQEKVLVNKSLLPDFIIGAAYGVRAKQNASNLLSLNIGISLPIFTKNSARLKASKTKIIKYKKSLQATIIETKKASITLFTKIVTTKKLLKLYTDELIPFAKLSVSSALSSYQVGRLEFSSLVSAQLLLYKYQVINENNINNIKYLHTKLDFIIGDNSEGDKK